MTQAPLPPMPSAPSRPPNRGRAGPGLVVSLLVMGFGVAIGIASAIAIIVPFAGTFTSHEYPAPGEFTLHLRHARYTVYERTGTQSGLGGFDFGDRSGVTIGPAQVTVIAPDGRPVEVFVDPDNESQTRGSAKYTGAVAFDAPSGGVYTVRVSSERATTVLVVRSLADVAKSVLVWFGAGFIGALVLIGGIVMLIVGVTRRGRAKRAAQYPGWGQPPSYGPPPGGSPPYGPPPGPWQPPPAS